MTDLECPRCFKKVDHLTEVMMLENDGTEITIVRCDDCWTVARKLLQNASNN